MTEQDFRENVIKGLECCGYSRFMDKCQECPYDGKGCFKRLKTDALALLRTMYTTSEVRNALIAHGQRDLRFELGEIIKYDPFEVEEILTKKSEVKTGD